MLWYDNIDVGQNRLCCLIYVVNSRSINQVSWYRRSLAAPVISRWITIARHIFRPLRNYAIIRPLPVMLPSRPERVSVVSCLIPKHVHYQLVFRVQAVIPTTAVPTKSEQWCQNEINIAGARCRSSKPKGLAEPGEVLGSGGKLLPTN